MGTLEANLTNRVQEILSSIEERIKRKKKKRDNLFKENIKLKKIQVENIKKIWNTMKRSNL